MAISNALKNILNKVSPGARKAGLGTAIQTAQTDISTLQSTVATKTGAETLTNKTIDSGSNYFKNTVLNYSGNVTTAQINSGITLVEGVTGRQIRFLRYSIVSNGAFNSGNGTGVVIQDTNSSPVVVTTIGKAALTNGAKISSGLTISGVTDGAGMVGNLTSGKGIAIKADADVSTGTSIDVSIYYMYV